MRLIMNGILLVLVYSESTKADCFIERGDLVKESPIVLRHDYYTATYLNNAIHLPAPNVQKIAINSNDIVYMACPGSQININNIPTRSTVKLFKCTNGKFDNHSFSSIRCDKIPESSVKIEQKSFFARKIFIIGFDIDTIFLKHIHGMFDDNLYTTLHTFHILTNSINGLKMVTAHNSFNHPYFPNCGDCYKQTNQKATISGLFSEPTKSIVKGYFERGRRYLAKGHLAPHADFNFAYQQKATYPYFNCVPQWQQINNNGNWGKLEKDIRELASRRRNYLNIYTGTVKISKFFGVELFLHYASGAKHMPVPKFMWKIVEDPSSGGAVAFVMSNNPYAQAESSSFRCTDVCNYVTHLINTAASNCNASYQKGCLYCCQVDNTLGQSIPDLPISPAPLLN